MSKNALVIIDVQNYFVNEHTKTLPQKLENLYKLMILTILFLANM